jgi:hypothetical protein
VQLVTRNNKLAGWLVGWLVASDVLEELERRRVVLSSLFLIIILAKFRELAKFIFIFIFFSKWLKLLNSFLVF